MDYPKSVENVGLVDGKFVDENPGTGTVGSLIPSAWGNAVTDEILGVLTAGGLIPDEADLTQLAQAIALISRSVVRGSTETISASTVLTADDRGLIIADAAAGNLTITLPASDADLGIEQFVLRRADTTANTLTIAAAGADKIMLDSTASPAGVASTELLFAGDYLVLRSDGAGKWWCVGQAQLPGSIASGIVVLSAAGTSNYSVPAILRSGRRRPKVTVVGGGGGGAGAASSANFNAAGGGGAGGGCAIKRIDLSGVSNVSVTVGAGGAAGTNGVTPGASGGTSSFGAYCSATGGQAGNPATGATSSTGIGAGNDGGVGTGGDLNLRGSCGNSGTAATPAVSGTSVAGGAGGASLINGGARASAATFGAGGGGNGTTSGSQTVSGLAGAAGAVIIEW